MDIKTTQHGVIIGRFQTPELHSEHIKLIQYVLDRHEKVILFLGVSPTLANKKHPMDFITRKYMIEEQFGINNGYTDELQLVFENGVLYNEQIFDEIRNIANSYL